MVRRSGPSPGSDGVTPERFERNLNARLHKLRHEILTGTYSPRLVRRFYARTFRKSKYDYRRKWLEVIDAFHSVTSEEAILDCLIDLLGRNFSAARISVWIQSDADRRFHQVRSVTREPAPPPLTPDHPLIEGFGRLGVCNSFTCQPFLNGNLPRCGQHVGWAEASAVVTANSVLGARTNPLPAMIDLVCAILGKVPYCGLHLDENRKGQVLVNVDLSKDTLNELDYALLGFFTTMVKFTSSSISAVIPPTQSPESSKTYFLMFRVGCLT